MSADALNRFIKRLAMDETLQEFLVEFGSRQGLTPGSGKLSERDIADFACQHGFQVTADEMRGRNLADELSAQPTAPLTALPKPGSRSARDSSDWWAWLAD